MNQLLKKSHLLLLIGFCLIQFNSCAKKNEKSQKLPNILWITCEDISPYIGCYGDKNAVTPAIDKLASQGVKYTNAYSNAPVCAPARFTLISGMHASGSGTHHMRSKYKIPSRFKTYPEYLREAGYYCTNNFKQDYNSSNISDSIWDECSDKAHYKNRKKDQPFMAVFNITVCHEGKVTDGSFKKFKLNHNPDSMVLPPYHPDVPEVRTDWARLYDNITRMDSIVQQILDDLEQNSLTDSTIIFFYSDHGGGLSRSKRFIYSTGTKVPLIVKVPEMYNHIEKSLSDVSSDRLVSFVDFAPTVLSLAGVKKPENMEGQSFLGKYKEEDPEYIYFFRGRMDERYDHMLGICDKQYRYIYNFMPERPYGQYLFTPWKISSLQAWEKAYKKGKCNEVQSIFWNTKPNCELYDMTVDPWEVNNLANDEKYADIKNNMHQALKEKIVTFKDASFIPEGELINLDEVGNIYDFTQSDKYPINEIAELAFLSANPTQSDISMFKNNLKHESIVMRYWSLKGLTKLISKKPEILNDIEPLIYDDSDEVKIIASEVLYKYGKKDIAIESFKNLLMNKNEWVVVSTLNVISIIFEDSVNIFGDEFDKLYKNPKNKYIKRCISYERKKM